MQLDNKNKIPLYQQVYEILRNDIENGSLQEGSLIYSENQLASQYSISRMTARAALKKLESEGYVSCDSSLGRRVNKPHGTHSQTFEKEYPDNNSCIGIYPFEGYQYDDFYYREITDGLSNTAVEQRVNLKILSRKDIRSGESIKNLVERNRINGVIWSKASLSEEFYELQKNNIPVVLLNLKKNDYDHVTTNHYQGACYALECLIHMGHSKIAYLGASNDKWHLHERKRAYMDTLQKYGLETCSSWIMENQPVDAESRESDLKIFKGKDRPTSLFIGGGTLLTKAMEALSSMKLKVPEDVSVISIDCKSYDKQNVSGMAQPCEKMASIALEFLIKKIKGSYTEPIGIELDQIFVPGETCAFNSEILSLIKSIKKRRSHET